MKHLLLSLSLILFLNTNILQAQSFYGSDAKAYIKNASEIHLNSKTNQIDYIQFDIDKQLNLNDLQLWITKQFQLSDIARLIEINRTTDKLNQTHIRYKLGVNNIPIHDAMIIAHIKDDKVFAINGIVQKNAVKEYQKSISETAALNFALQKINAKVYKWQIKEEEAFIKRRTNNPEATYFPKAEMEIIRNKNTNNYNLSYKFNIYAHKPMSRAEVYVDANNGDILFTNNLIQHSDSIGTAYTKYSNTQVIIADSFNSTFRLRESSRGLGIETYDMNNSTVYSSAVDFIDTNNIWDNVNPQQDEVATDAHWGLEMTYDYYLNRHNRNSIDGNGYKLEAYVHYDLNYVNAYWNGQFMTFGDGNSTWGPLVALDIVGHEITHGLTSNTADLDYQDESGAMNEAFSDIFGTSIEFYAKPTTANWLIGEDIGSALRSMSDPNSKGDPDTYMGTNYYTGSADNGGVHTNSGVLNYIYYLMSDGGTGTNDINNTYTVTGIGVDSASQIAFRALTVYLVNTSQYMDARFYFIKSAIDLYGPCSGPVETTTNAFYAAGIGSQYIAGVHASFSSNLTTYCQPPASVTFENTSSNGLNFHWDFGDGDTSSLYNPIHTYSSYGSYNVKLIADGGSCGLDSIIKSEYISVSTNNPCIYNMPTNGSQTLNSCTGILFDSGGPNNYASNTNVTTVISPVGATSIDMIFTIFDFESGYDYLKIYDGTSASAPLIGSYDGTNLPNGGTVTANSGSMTLVQTSDVAVEQAGFVASWQCVFSATPPISSFEASDTNSCSGEIQFTDLSQNGPTSWSWDFGDGYTSIIKNPTHTYNSNGTYTVSLTATNSYGFNQITKSNYITVDKPWSPTAADEALCNNGSITFNATNTSFGTIKWYTSQNSTNPIDTGLAFTTPNLTQTTNYWLENSVDKPIMNVGKAAINSNGNILSYQQSLIFDVYKEAILKSVKVYSNYIGTSLIKLKNSLGLTIAQKTVNIIVGWNTVELGFNLEIGTDFSLEGKDLYRNNSGVNFPYTLPGILSITKSSAATNPMQYYYYFYDWEVQEKACTSDRIKVTAYINNSAPSVDFTNTINDPIVSFTNNTTNSGHCYWSFGDGKYSQVTNPVHTYLQNGTYQVRLKIDNDCGIDSIIKTVVISSATSINSSNNNDEIKLFPNPNNGEFKIQFSGKNNYKSISIIDVLGNIILNKNVELNQKVINFDINTFSSGVYFARLISENKISVIRIIKQ